MQTRRVHRTVAGGEVIGTPGLFWKSDPPRQGWRDVVEWRALLVAFQNPWRALQTWREPFSWDAPAPPTYPDVFPNTKAYGSFDVTKIDDYDRDAAQASLYFRPTFTTQNPPTVQDMRGNVSEIVSNGTRFAVVGPSSLSSPTFGINDAQASLIPAEGAFSDVGFRFAIDAEPDTATADIPQLFAAELARLP